MRDKKRVFKMHSQVEYKSLETYFEEMAAKGWLIEKMGFGMTFKRIEPQKLTFNVAIISPKTMLDWPDKETTGTFDDFCESAGWQLAATNQIYRIYYRPAEIDGPPIYTEEEDVYSAVRSNFFKSDFVMIFLPLLYLVNLCMNLSHKRYDMFASNIQIFSLMMPFFLIAMFWMISMPSLYWVLINKRRLSEGQNLFYFSPRWVMIKNRFLTGFMALYFIVLLYALIYDPFNNYSLRFIAAGILPPLIAFIIMYVFINFIKKEDLPLYSKIAIMVATCIISIGIITGLMIAFIGFDFLDGDEKGPIAPDVNRLTLEELGYSETSEIDWRYVDSSVFVPLSYEYAESLDVDDKNIYIRVEYLRNRTEVLANWSLQTALENEREHYLEELLYSPELANYIVEITVDNPYGALVYNLSESRRAIIIQRNHEIYRLRSTEVFDDEMLERALKGLFEE